MYCLSTENVTISYVRDTSSRPRREKMLIHHCHVKQRDFSLLYKGFIDV